MTTTITDYEEYLQSATWKHLRAQALTRDGCRCRCCNSDFSLNVHHRRYPKRWGTETLDDLTTLCRDCHQRVHGLIPPPTAKQSNAWKFVVCFAMIVLVIMLFAAGR